MIKHHKNPDPAVALNSTQINNNQIVNENSSNDNEVEPPEKPMKVHQQLSDQQLHMESPTTTINSNDLVVNSESVQDSDCLSVDITSD